MITLQLRGHAFQEDGTGQYHPVDYEFTPNGYPIFLEMAEMFGWEYGYEYLQGLNREHQWFRNRFKELVIP